MCTLRAAIQEANANGNPADLDSITFNQAVTEGKTITLGSVLPDVTQQVIIDGCGWTSVPTGPCVGIEGPGSTGDAFKVSGGNASQIVWIQGFAITNSDHGIIYSGSNNFIVRNSWFGIDIDGNADSTDANVTGMEIDGSGAGIGSGTGVGSAGTRNVFGNNTTGLRIFQGDNNVVVGNYFGTKPDGVTAAPNTSDSIEVVGGLNSDPTPTNDPPTNNYIGDAPPSTEAASAACDSYCNVISGGGSTGTGIDLQGEGTETPAGQTFISGNYIGLAADGATALPNNVGIEVGGADHVGIGSGGPDYHNVITGGSIGVRAGPGDAESLSLSYNYLGTNSSGEAPLSPPTSADARIRSVTPDLLDPSTSISHNVMALGGNGLELSGTNGLVMQNSIGISPTGADLGSPTAQSSTSGLLITGAAEGDTETNIVSGNAIGNAGDGIGITGADGNSVYSNLVGTDGTNTQPNTGYGIRIGPSSGANSTGNDIGQTSAANTLSNNMLGAIGVFGAGSAGNTLLYNAGSGNGDATPIFTDLGGDGPGNASSGPHEGIARPVVLAASTDRVTGLGKPGATVRVHFKNSSDAGEVASVGPESATVDSEGVWTLDYSTSTPAQGQIVSATQSTATSGTSELATPKTTQTDSGDSQAPSTSIQGPEITNDSTPAFDLGADEPTSAFVCRLGSNGPWSECSDPATLGPLSDGGYALQARAIDQDARIDPGFAEHDFTVDTTAPDSRIDTAPPIFTSNPQPTIGYSVQGEAHPSAFQCALDGSAVACSGQSSGTFTPAAPLADGQHTFTVRAVDAAGNQDATPATWQFTVDTVAPDTRIDYGPYGKVTSSTPVFGFSSPEGSGIRFRCRFDAQQFAPCTNASQDTPASPLSPGKHVFEVQAVDRAANVDPTPAGASFTVGACNGRAATYVGTARGDLLKGTPKPDVIVGLGGGDVIKGFGGNDVLCGGGGRDRMDGGPGRDTLFGQGGADSLVGGPGKDRLVGGAGKDAQRP